MAELIVSGSAADDLDRIYDWSAEQFGTAVAETYVQTIRERFYLLREYPKAGEAHGGVSADYRAIPCGSHRVIYRLDGNRVRVVRVLHSAQSMEGL